jgi:hypothetical protein
MTGPGTEDEALTAAAGNVPASKLPGRGHGPVPGSDPAPEARQVRHLVIFRAPVAGFARPPAVVSGPGV